MGNKTNVAVGDKFGNRTIIELVDSNNKHRKVKVRCDCGKEFISRADAIKNYKVLSCGCYLVKINNLVG